MSGKTKPPGEAMSRVLALHMRPATYDWITALAKRRRTTRAAVLRDLLNRGFAALRAEQAAAADSGKSP